MGSSAGAIRSRPGQGLVVDIRTETPTIETGRPFVPFLDLEALHIGIETQIVEAWRQILREASFIGGAAVARFEGELAKYLDVPSVVGVGNGTDALTLALKALGIKPGDEVITQANTFVATIESIVHAGGVPVLADVDPLTATLDPLAVDFAITRKTRFIVPVHLYGQAAPMKPLMELANAHGLTVVEDNAQSLGATYQGRKVGSLGHASSMSFYPGKNLGAAGDAGAIAFNDPDAASRARSMANHGRTGPTDHGFIGHNSRLDSLQAAVLSIKLEHLDGWNAHRRHLADAYHQLLGELPVELPHSRVDGEHIFHLYVIRHPNRDDLAQDLKGFGVATGLHYPRPIHFQEPYVGLGHGPGSFPVSEAWARSLLSLPMCPTLGVDQIRWVAESIANSLEGRDARADSTI